MAGALPMLTALLPVVEVGSLAGEVAGVFLPVFRVVAEVAVWPGMAPTGLLAPSRWIDLHS